MAAVSTTSSTPAIPSGAQQLSNQLANSSSPYLRAHRNNPVAWQEWSPETIDLARKNQKLIFLSIGYSACHWCHVMERESFTSSEVADILNESFIPIKLDRESRPDLDDIYMNYVMATTGSGGWPLNVFLTPLLQPVFGGTYWPGPASGSVASSDTDDKPLTFLDILVKMQDVWQNERQRCLQSAADITRQLRAFAAEGVYAHNAVHIRGAGENDPLEPLDIDLIDDALDHFVGAFDNRHGGFASTPTAPKFATPPNITFLLRIGASITRPSTHTRFGFPSPIPAILGKKSCTTAATMAVQTLLTISRSGLRDQIGHGFHRYSVTPDWNLPHFEKMVYDNAQLLTAYLDAWALGRDPEILGTIYDLVEYFTDPSSPIVRPDGGWYSSEDADSTPVPTSSASIGTHDDKKEGAFYVWTFREFVNVLGEHDAAILSRHFGVKEDGNIPHAHDVNDEFLRQNVLHISATPSVLAKEFGLKETEIVNIIKTGKAKLKEFRQTKRGVPDVDDKVIVAVNALVISAVARASITLRTIDQARAQRCKDAALKAMSFIKTTLFNPTTGKLTRIFSATSGSADAVNADVAFVDDYAYMVQALIKIYDMTIDKTYLDFAFILQATLDTSFYAESDGGYFQAAKSDSSAESNVLSPPAISSSSTNDRGVGTTIPETSQSGQTESTAQSGSEQAQPTDQILNLKPGTDNSLPSPNGVIAQNLLYLASFAASFDTDAFAASSALTSTSITNPAEQTKTRSETLRYQARKTIDAFAPEIIQHPFLYVTMLGAIVLDAVGIKSLITPASMSDAVIEAKGLRGFGHTVIRLPAPTMNGNSGIKEGEVMICTQGMCRLLKDGELDDLGDYVDEDDDITSTSTVTTATAGNGTGDSINNNNNTVQQINADDKRDDTIGFPEGETTVVDPDTKEKREEIARQEDLESRQHGSSASATVAGVDSSVQDPSVSVTSQVASASETETVTDTASTQATE